MYGYFGRYLDVNLSTGEVQDYEIPEEWVNKHLGGRGVCARIFLEELEGGEDPLGPDNLLIFGTGPLQGTGIGGAGRNLVMSKSPKTNSVSDSYVGGFFNYELGTSGYDGIIIRGKAKIPKYLSLIKGTAKINDADELWGMTTAETEEKLQEIYGKTARVTAVGVAGENLVKFACIISDRSHAAGRPGFGAVMGSKRLKAIVVRGGIKKPIMDEQALRTHQKALTKAIIGDPGHALIAQFGTSMGVMYHQRLGTLPTKNFQEAVFDHAEQISGERMSEKMVVGHETCAGCPLGCRMLVSTEFNGEKVEPKYGAPEYETLGAFGSLCLNNNLASIALMNQLCNMYGLDTISTGNLLAFLMEATERGLIDRKNGLDWGDARGMVKMIHQIAKREGFGDVLAKGLDYVASEIGGQDFAIQIKGQEVPLHEPRGKMAFALSYATTPRGAVHTEGVHDNWLESGPLTPELGITDPMDRFDWTGKARVQKIYTDLQSFTNTLIVCSIAIRSLGEYYPEYYPRLREIVEAVTGRKITADDMLTIGERNYILLHLLRAREGYKVSDDDLPKRFKESLPSGPSANRPISDELLKEKINEYYELRGFDEYGPTDKKLDELDLGEFK